MAGVSFLSIWQSPDLVNSMYTDRGDLLRLYTWIIFVILTVGVGVLIIREFTQSKTRYASKLITWIAFAIPMLFIYLFSFNHLIAPNGDNAEYIISSQSLVDKGGVYRLNRPSQNENSLASLGLPILLAPIYAIWGIDIAKMKYLIFLMSLLIAPLLYCLFNRQHSTRYSLLLTLVCFSSPYLVGTSSTIMTETPYLCWSLSALLLSMIYVQQKAWRWAIYRALLFAGVMTYLTRAVGIGVFIALIIHLLIHVPWKMASKNLTNLLQNSVFRRTLAILIPAFLGMLVWQIKQGSLAVSQADLLFQGDLAKRWYENIFALKNVIGQMLFSPDILRWYRLSPDHSLPGMHWGWILIVLVLLIGLLNGLLKKQLFAIYTLTVAGLILLASVTPQERVMVRYFSILIPFLIYYFIQGVSFCVHLIQNRWDNTTIKLLSKALPLIFLFQIFLTNLSGNQFNVLTKSPVYNSYYQSFLDAARWCGNHLPDSAYIMSVKPRIVYVLSGHQGISMSSERDQYDDLWAQKKLREIHELGVTHLIVDAISLTTKNNIYPLLENNPTYFQALDVPGLNNQCTVVKVEKQ